MVTTKTASHEARSNRLLCQNRRELGIREKKKPYIVEELVKCVGGYYVAYESAPTEYKFFMFGEHIGRWHALTGCHMADTAGRWHALTDCVRTDTAGRWHALNGCHMANPAAQCHALTDCYGRHRRRNCGGLRYRYRRDLHGVVRRQLQADGRGLRILHNVSC